MHQADCRAAHLNPSSSTPGQLEVEWRMPAAAALIELALCGRLGTVSRRSFFKDGNGMDLVVLDPTPTGDACLDVALAVLAAREGPTRPRKAWLAVTRGVVAAVHAGLEAQGLATPVTGRGSRPTHLRIDDPDGFRRTRHHLSVLRSFPERVTDPRAGAFIDVMRSGADSHRGEQGWYPEIRWEWYPGSVRPAAEGILMAERMAFA